MNNLRIETILGNGLLNRSEQWRWIIVDASKEKNSTCKQMKIEHGCHRDRLEKIWKILLNSQLTCDAVVNRDFLKTCGLQGRLWDSKLSLVPA